MDLSPRVFAAADVSRVVQQTLHGCASLKIFVTAVAIVDDLGAVLVIALFYTAEFARAPLALAALVFIALLLMNRSGIRNATSSARWAIRSP